MPNKTGFSGPTFGAAKGAAENIAQEVVDSAIAVGVVIKGKWNAQTNTPPLSNATGQAGWCYDVVVAGDFQGDHYLIGDVIKHNGSEWYRIPKGIESNGPIIVKYLKETDTEFPMSRASGMPIIVGDMFAVDQSATLNFTIGGIKITSYADIIEYTGNGNFQKKIAGNATSNEVAISNPPAESESGSSLYQDQVNAENKQALAERELLRNKLTSEDQYQSGDTDSYFNANAVKGMMNKKVDTERKFAGLKLDQDRTANELVDTFKELARTYKNVTFDCDDNTLKNILLSCFKSGVVQSTIPAVVLAEEYQLATLKAVYDYVNSIVLGDIRRKGEKATIEEIYAIVDPRVNDMWECKANHHSYLYTESGWIDKGSGFDLSSAILKQDVVDNFNIADSQKAASANTVRILKALVDGKQDKFDLDGKGEELPILNPNITFISRKLNFMMDMEVINIECAPQTPITNKQSQARELLRMPVPPTNFSYPSKMRIEITKPSGYYTCEENRHAFYDIDGDNYINPNVASGVSMRCKTINKVDGAYDSDGNEVLIAQQLKNSSGALVVNADGSPRVYSDIVVVQQGGVENPKVYALKMNAGSGYVFRDKYYDEYGNEVIGDFYELVEVPIAFDLQYMYKCYLMNKQLQVVGRNFIVDENGRLCEYKIIESENSKLVQATLDNAVFSFYKGFAGTITITPITFANFLDQITVDVVEHKSPDPENPGEEIIDYYSLMAQGSNVYSDILIQRSF